MLVLSRNEGEKVILKIGDEHIVVTLVEIRNWKGVASKVRLGFEASQHVQIFREELLNAAEPA